LNPAVDGERDHIGSTLQETGKAKALRYYTPTNSIQEARNATGGGYHSDGRTLVMFSRAMNASCESARETT